MRDDVGASLSCDDRTVDGSLTFGGRNLSSDRKVALLSKRAMDIALTLAVMPIIVPFVAAVSAFVLVRVGGPVFFVHKRVGRDGREFGCIKFRTMVLDSSAALQRHLARNPKAREEWERTQKLENDPRILPGIGGILRSTSLDELPQFFNVLRGDMSLVGPRPVTREELARYGSGVRYYTALRPGITGKWQVSGRSEIEYSERVQMDVDYVRNWSIFGDLKLLAKTVSVVLKRDGAV